MRRALRFLVFVACVFFTAAALNNVYSDNTEVKKLAHEVACQGEVGKCGAEPTSTERSAFAQNFEFPGAKTPIGVHCSRAYVFVGEYACVLR